MSQALPSIQENADEEFVTFANIASFVASHWRALLISVFAGGLLGYAGSFLAVDQVHGHRTPIAAAATGLGDSRACLTARAH